MTTVEPQTAEAVLKAVEDVIASQEPQPPVKPPHRVPFHWPPHPVSKDFHVLPSDWTGHAELKAFGQVFDVEIARTAQGVFGRIVRIWNEARGSSVEEVLVLLEAGAKPYLERKREIALVLGTGELDTGTIADLPPSDLVRLLYSRDRDIAHEAQLAIETQASSGIFSDALNRILEDDRHPLRRSAQWCVLDMYEDLPSFAPGQSEQDRAVSAIKRLIIGADDDFARTVYKAGVVLGGHICTQAAAEALYACAARAKKYGRRSAIHALFHLAEWMPSQKVQILETLERATVDDPEPLLREFASSMARDVRAGAYEHMTEPGFPEED